MKKASSRFVFAVLFILALPFAGADAGQSGYKGFPRGNALITVHELKQLLDSCAPNLVILAAAGGIGYRAAHIPGAYQVDRPDYEAPPDTQSGVTGNLIEAAGFTELAQRLGINRD